MHRPDISDISDISTTWMHPLSASHRTWFILSRICLYYVVCSQSHPHALWTPLRHEYWKFSKTSKFPNLEEALFLLHGWKDRRPHDIVGPNGCESVSLFRSPGVCFHSKCLLTFTLFKYNQYRSFLLPAFASHISPVVLLSKIWWLHPALARSQLQNESLHLNAL